MVKMAIALTVLTMCMGHIFRSLADFAPVLDLQSLACAGRPGVENPVVAQVCPC